MIKEIGEKNTRGFKALLFNRCAYKKKDKCYALVGYGEITQKPVRVQKDKKGEWVKYDGRKIYLD